MLYLKNIYTQLSDETRGTYTATDCIILMTCAENKLFLFYTTVESKTAYVYEYKNSIKTPLKYLDSNVSISPPFHEYAG